jgi:hypothetical protein
MWKGDLVTLTPWDFRFRNSHDHSRETSLTSSRDAVTVRGMVSVRGTAAVLVILLTLVLCSLVRSASAHPGLGRNWLTSAPIPVSAGPAAPLSTLTASPAPGVLSGLAGIGALLVALVTWRSRRRAVVVILMGLLAILAYEDGLHSVHHGNAPRAAGSCPFLAVSAHAVGIEAETSDLAIPTLVALGPALCIVAHSPADHVVRPDQGRAPPASPSL